jgi:hypothetical protein
MFTSVYIQKDLLWKPKFQNGSTSLVGYHFS